MSIEGATRDGGPPVSDFKLKGSPGGAHYGGLGFRGLGFRFRVSGLGFLLCWWFLPGGFGFSVQASGSP